MDTYSYNSAPRHSYRHAFDDDDIAASRLREENEHLRQELRKTRSQLQTYINSANANFKEKAKKNELLELLALKVAAYETMPYNPYYREGDELGRDDSILDGPLSADPEPAERERGGDC